MDEDKLAALDQLENHPDFYVRRPEPIVCDGNSKTEMQCWTYFLPRFRPELLELATHACYDAHGEHGLKYVARYLRHQSIYSSKYILGDSDQA